MKELKKVNRDVLKIIDKYHRLILKNEKSKGEWLPEAIKEWMTDLHRALKKQGYIL